MKKNDHLPFSTTFTELESLTLSEISQSETDKQPCDFTHMWNLRNKTGKEKRFFKKGGALKYREHTDRIQKGAGLATESTFPGESLHCTPETQTTLYVNYTGIHK